MLLDCVALLHAAGLPVTCRVIGDGPQRAALHDHAERLGISHAVDFRHDVWERKDLYSLVKAARVAVFPSAREGFGIAVLEAIACGIPVVTTSAPDNLAQHLVARSAAGIVCDPSAGAIADALRMLLAAPHGEQEDITRSACRPGSMADRVRLGLRRRSGRTGAWHREGRRVICPLISAW